MQTYDQKLTDAVKFQICMKLSMLASALHGACWDLTTQESLRKIKNNVLSIAEDHLLLGLCVEMDARIREYA